MSYSIPLLLQDECRGLAKWFSSRLGARYQVQIMNNKLSPPARKPTCLVLIEPGVGLALYYGRKVVAFDRSTYNYTCEDIQGVLNHPILKDQEAKSP